MKKSPFDYSDEDISKTGRRAVLGSPTPDFGCTSKCLSQCVARSENVNDTLRSNQFEYFEITLTVPPSKTWMMMTAEQQRHYMYKCWCKIVKNFSNVEAQHSYEFTKKGQIHLHGSIKYYGKCFIDGFISDIVKLYLRNFKRPFDVKNYYPDMRRYYSAPIVVQHRSSDDEQHIMEWETYLRKNN